MYMTLFFIAVMSLQTIVSIREVVHMVDNHDLVICLEKFTYLSLRQGARMLISTNTSAKRCSKMKVTVLRQQSIEYFCELDNIANCGIQSYMSTPNDSYPV